MGEVVSYLQTQIQDELILSLGKVFVKFMELAFSSIPEFLEFISTQLDGFLQGLGDMFLLSLQPLFDSVANQNDAIVSPEHIDAVLPQLQELQSQLTNPNENLSQVLAGVSNVQSLLSELANEISTILNSSSDDIINDIINNFSPYVINLVGDFFGENAIINELINMAFSAIAHLVPTIAEELKVCLEAFKLHASTFLSTLSDNLPENIYLNTFLSGYDNLLNAGLAIFSTIKEMIEENPEVLNDENLEGLFQAIYESDDFQIVMQVVNNNPYMYEALFNAFYYAVGSLFSVDWFDQLAYYAFDFGQLIVNKLSEISSVIQG